MVHMFCKLHWVTGLGSDLKEKESTTNGIDSRDRVAPAMKKPFLMTMKPGLYSTIVNSEIY